MSEDRKSDLVQIGALWKNENKDGETYLSGTFGAAKLLVFKNKWKKGEKDPDYKIFVGRRVRKEEGDEKKEVPAETPAEELPVIQSEEL